MNSNRSVLVIFSVIFFSIFANSSETVKGAKKDFEVFKQEMTLKLQTLGSEIENLKEKTKTKSTEAHGAALQEIEESRVKIAADLQKLEKASESNWKKLKKNIAESIRKLDFKAQELLKENEPKK